MLNRPQTLPQGTLLYFNGFASRHALDNLAIGEHTNQQKMGLIKRHQKLYQTQKTSNFKATQGGYFVKSENGCNQERTGLFMEVN
jgi:hypothetical protein